MITSSGIKCDVCGKYILPIHQEEQVNIFEIACIRNTLHCDNACRVHVEHSLEKKDYRLLPQGPLRMTIFAMFNHSEFIVPEKEVGE